MHKLCTLLVALCLVGQVTGQDVRTRNAGTDAPQPTNRTVRGRILDDTGEPAAGATVQIVDRNGRTVTGGFADANGNYSLSFPEGEGLRLRASFVGAAPQVVALTAQESYDFTLKQDVTLDEVVVTGYGQEQSKRDIRGAASSVDGAAVQQMGITTVDAALQGRIAGVNITQASGVAGSAVRFIIRGPGSVSGKSDPLIIIDGVPVSQEDYSKRDGPTNATNANPLANLNPNDIESYTVLKDAYQTAIYGARGGNGVVLITTKRGKAGKTKITLNYQQGVQEAANTLDLLSGQEWLALYSEAYENTNNAPLPPDFSFNTVGGSVRADQIANTNWQDELLRTGNVRQLDVSAEGGNEKTTFFTGISHRIEDAMLLGNTFERISARFNIRNQATDKLMIISQVGITHTNNWRVPVGFNGGLGNAESTTLNIAPIRNPDGSYFGSQNQSTGANPIAQLENRYLESGTRLLGNLQLDLEILPGLKLNVLGGGDILNQRDDYFISPNNRWVVRRNFSGGTFTPIDTVQAGAIEERAIRVQTFNSYATLRYTTAIAERHSLTGIIGSEINYSSRRDMGIYTNGPSGFLDPYFNNNSSSITYFDTGLPVTPPAVGGYNANLDEKYSFLSYFGRVEYGFDEKYTAAATLRVDGSSKFGENNKYGTFYAVALGWVLTKENFMQSLNWVDFAKLRATYGTNGVSDGIPNFGYIATYGPSGGYLGTSGLEFNRYPNPDLSWETIEQFDLGLTFELFKGRVSGTVDYFVRNSSDVLLNKRIQASSGRTQTLVNSDVEIRNSGLEFEIVTQNFRGEFNWSTSFNIAFLNSEVTSTGGQVPDAFEFDFGDTRLIEGHPAGIHYLVRSAGVNPANGEELYYRRDGSITNVWSNTDRVPVGKPFPDFFGGFTNNFAYKGIDLSILFSFSVGNTIYDDGAKNQIGNMSWNQRTDVLARWRQPGDVTNVPAVRIDRSPQNTDRFLYNADFLRLRQLSLGYTLPKAWTDAVSLQNVRIYVTGTNLLLFTEYPGADPEVARTFFSRSQSNVSYAAPYLPTPQARQILGGITITL